MSASATTVAGVQALYVTLLAAGALVSYDGARRATDVVDHQPAVPGSERVAHSTSRSSPRRGVEQPAPTGEKPRRQPGRVPDDARSCRGCRKPSRLRISPMAATARILSSTRENDRHSGSDRSRGVAAHPTSAWATPLPRPGATPRTTNTTGTSVLAGNPATTTRPTYPYRGRRRSRK